ncbi:MAG TPA: TIGR04283 family arsenosugar biosynthesis glycosyltransferase [Thermoanaerobaculia bacterium]|nr:TIGR04283 family arsenosugar biosynthesis glycosyltransferase [Thermoanaerobaculia bacterium]
MLASSLFTDAPRASRLTPQLMRLAIVVPTLNEEGTLRRTLPAALAVADELVVSDGGSGDRTPEVAGELGARVIRGPAGRGGQLNRGAAATSAELLLFLHADTTLPAAAPGAIRAAIAGGAVGGAFLMRFDTEPPLLRLGSRLINLRTRWTRLPLGDQAQFVTREAFAALGGFRDWPLLEDLDFAWRLRKHGRTAILADKVTTGARRFLELGVVRTVTINWLIWAAFVAGVPPRRLARFYRQVR